MRKSTVLLALCIALGFLVVPSFASSGAEPAADPALDPVYSVASDTAYVLLSSAAPASSGISLLASSTPVYPSGVYSFYYSDSPSSSPISASGDFYTAVAGSLKNGFATVSRGLYSLHSDNSSVLTRLTNWNYGLFGTLNLSGSGATTFPYVLVSSNGYVSGGSSSVSGALPAINYNLYHGFQSMVNGFAAVRTSVNDGFSLLDLSVKDSDFFRTFASAKTYSFSLWDENGQRFPQEGLTSFFGMVSSNLWSVNSQLSGVLNRMSDPLESEIKKATEAQEQEFKDEFTGEGSKGVQKGQSSSMGDLSSSAGSLLDSGGSIGNVFSEIGNSGSSVWSWFSQENANAINGVGGAALISDDDLDQPEIEVVDFYGAQREELLSMLGGG